MSNYFSNRVSASLSVAAINNIKTALSTIKTNLPFAVGLTDDERITLPKINEANRLFVSDAINAVSNNAGMLPAYFTPTEMKLDYDLYVALDELVLLCTQTTELMRDTQMLAGSEAFVGALTAYRLIGAAAKAGVPGADAVYASMEERFKNQGPASSPAPVTP